MKDKQNKNTILFFTIAILLVLLDQITKLTIKGFSFAGFEIQGLRYGESIPILGNLLQLTFVENEGMAFGISFGWGKIFLSIFSLIASGFLAYYLYLLCKFSKNNLLKFSIALILAGAFGNAIDRNFYGIIFNESPLFYGRVVDFILVNIPDINLFGITYSHFPVFNIADACVTCRVILLVIMHKKLPEINELLSNNKKNIKNKENLENNLENKENLDNF